MCMCLCLPVLYGYIYIYIYNWLYVFSHSVLLLIESCAFWHMCCVGVNFYFICLLFFCIIIFHASVCAGECVVGGLGGGVFSLLGLEFG